MRRPLAESALIHLVLILLSAVFIFPFLWVVSTAVKPKPETMRIPPVWIPSKWEFGNFTEAMTYGSEKLGYIPFLVYGINTITICILVVAGVIISNSLVAYSFARLKWKGRDFMFAVTLATMMVPFPVLMVPTFAL